jgi:hypothetical protein
VDLWLWTFGLLDVLTRDSFPPCAPGKAGINQQVKAPFVKTAKTGSGPQLRRADPEHCYEETQNEEPDA